MLRLLAIAAGALWLAATPARADYWSDFQAAVDAYAAQRYDEAAADFTPLAERGDDRAQYWLGIMYFEGKGVPHDDRAAYMWLTLAAEGGNRAARLGRDGLVRRMSEADVAAAERLVAARRP